MDIHQARLNYYHNQSSPFYHIITPYHYYLHVIDEDYDYSCNKSSHTLFQQMRSHDIPMC